MSPQELARLYAERMERAKEFKVESDIVIDGIRTKRICLGTYTRKLEMRP